MRSSDSQRSGLIFDEAANLWHLKCPKVSSRLKGAHVQLASEKLATFVQLWKENLYYSTMSNSGIVDHGAKIFTLSDEHGYYD